MTNLQLEELAKIMRDYSLEEVELPGVVRVKRHVYDDARQALFERAQAMVDEERTVTDDDILMNPMAGLEVNRG